MPPDPEDDRHSPTLRDYGIMLAIGATTGAGFTWGLDAPLWLVVVAALAGAGLGALVESIIVALMGEMTPTSASVLRSRVMIAPDWDRLWYTAPMPVTRRELEWPLIVAAVIVFGMLAVAVAIWFALPVTQ